MFSLILIRLLSLRRLPRSTIFPYTTLFRSTTDDDLAAMIAVRVASDPDRPPPRIENLRHMLSAEAGLVYVVARLPQTACRSEEHTSELQSHSDLVCRLLLEKTKISPAYHIF